MRHPAESKITTASKKVIEILKDTAPLEWYRYSPAKETDEQLRYPPLIVWRFTTDPKWTAKIEKLGTILAQSVDNFRGRVAWELSHPGRNWTLTTEHMNKLWSTGEYRVDTQLWIDVAEKDPDHGLAANLDLFDLVEHISIAIESQMSQTV